MSSIDTRVLIFSIFVTVRSSYMIATNNFGPSDSGILLVAG